LTKYKIKVLFQIWVWYGSGGEFMAKEITNKNSTNVNTKKNTNRTSSKKVNTKSAKNLKNKKGTSKFNIKVIFCLIGIILIIAIIIISFSIKPEDKVVITIDKVEYTESDFNMYAYLIKYDYFGIDGTDLGEDVLNTQVSNDSEQTIGEYLKEKTISKMKVSAAVLRIAKENNITLNEDDLEEIETEKKEFIENLGGKSSYEEMLKNNFTNDEAYIEVAKINKLYEVIFESLYDEGKRNDLTEDEIINYTNNYQTDYVKIKQIILLKKDLETNQYLDETTLNQKELLAKDLAKKAKDGTDFDSLIKKYSESYDKNYTSEYYLKSDLVTELKDAINLLDEGDISNVVSATNAYHIIIREKLDDKKLNDYLDSKRQQKLIQNVSDNLEKIAIINNDYLEEITVK